MMIGFEGPILIVAFILWIAIVIYLKLKSKATNLYLFFFTVFYIYLCFVIDYTQFPIILNEQMAEDFGQNVWTDANLIPFNLEHFAIKTSILNIVLTIPFGFGFPFIAKATFKRMATAGLLIGISLEMLQLIMALLIGFTTRYVDINDVLFNFLGTLAGYTLFKVFVRLFKMSIQKFNIQLNSFLKYVYNDD
ncbi:VanZ family protein [Alkalibacillus almallahensis]|uniref:VanZ family protein n=1 Tax=Alkalibacillus almallahensis TaxID=1379154 RepID=UPI001420BE3E|nr:VanZ family protein [Alkalibacillus almallahensis]NIK11732.1 glycopeptide antibiotics resistance protein [Alkalibacillus almallahensis]